MRQTRLIIILTVGLILSGCNMEVSFEEVKIDELATIEIPNYFSEQDFENPDASLQYGHLFKEHYLLVVLETKEELEMYGVLGDFDLDSYAELTVDLFSESVGFPIVNKVNNYPKMINETPAYIYVMQGELIEENIDIFYYITVLEGEKAFYVIYSWCLLEDKMKFEPEMKIISSSIKEIKS